VIDDARSEAGATSEVRAALLDRRADRIAQVGKRTCRAGESRWCRQLRVHSCFTQNQMTRHLDNYRCTLLCGILRGSFKETARRKTTENTAKHRGSGLGSVVANHRGGGERSMVVTTLRITLSCLSTDFFTTWCT